MTTLKGFTIKDCPGTAIRVDGVENFRSEDVGFDNVGTPYEINGVKYGQVTGTRITNDPKLHQRKKRNQSTVGWRRPKGPPLPVFCPQCKSIFPSANYVFGGSFFLFWNNEEECINCEFAGARLSEGLFNLSRAVVEVLSAPDMTYSMVQAIASIAAEGFRSSASADALTDRIGFANPKLGQLLRKAGEISASALPWFMLVLQLYALILARQQLRDPTPGQELKVLEQILGELSRHDFSTLRDKRPAEVRQVAA